MTPCMGPIASAAKLKLRARRERPRHRRAAEQRDERAPLHGVSPTLLFHEQTDVVTELTECLNTQYRASRIMLSGVSAARRT